MSERPVAPTRAQRVMPLEGVGEVTVQAMGLTDKFRIASMKVENAQRMVQILAVCVLWEGEPLWSPQEWESFGSVEGNESLCMDLCSTAYELAKPEKKTLARTSDSP